MELIRPLVSTAVRFLRYQQSGVFIPDLVAGIKERYKFWEAPSNLAEWNQDTGARFATGKFGEFNVASMHVFSNGIVAQGEINTLILDDLLQDVIRWAKNSNGIEFIVSQPIEKNFNSTVEVKASADFLSKFQTLENTRNLLSEIVKSYGFPVVDYVLNGLTLQSEANSLNPIQTSKFVFERRIGARNDENVFFSEAPIATDQHIELLTELERSF